MVHSSDAKVHMSLRGQVFAGGGESGVMARVLETLGELARVAGLSLRPHVPEILPLIIEALNDASNSKKAVAITTLGKVGRHGCLTTVKSLLAGHLGGPKSAPLKVFLDLNPPC